MTNYQLLTLALIFAAHWVVQFVAWSMAANNAAAHALWLVVSAPMAYVANSLMNSSFMVAATLNSAIWAAAITLILARLMPAR